MTPKITLLLEVSYRPGVVGCLIAGCGYWLEDLIDRVEVSTEDHSRRYTVHLSRRDASKAVSCTCPDRQYRPGKANCKHQLAVNELMKTW